MKERTPPLASKSLASQTHSHQPLGGRSVPRRARARHMGSGAAAVAAWISGRWLMRGTALARWRGSARAR